MTKAEKIRQILHKYAKWNLDMVEGEVPNKYEASLIEREFIERILAL